MIKVVIGVLLLFTLLEGSRLVVQSRLKAGFERPHYRDNNYYQVQIAKSNPRFFAEVSHEANNPPVLPSPSTGGSVGDSREYPSALPAFTSRGGERPYEADTVFKTVSVQNGAEREIIGEATYFHPSLAGGIMRGSGGQTYDPSDPTIAAVADIQGQPVVELGTLLQICHNGRCIWVTAKDTGRFPGNHLDLSEAAFQQLAPTSRGRIPITWQVDRHK